MIDFLKLIFEPRRHQVTKKHKEILVKLCAFVSLWFNYFLQLHFTRTIQNFTASCFILFAVFNTYSPVH